MYPIHQLCILTRELKRFNNFTLFDLLKNCRLFSVRWLLDACYAVIAIYISDYSERMLITIWFCLKSQSRSFIYPNSIFAFETN